MSRRKFLVGAGIALCLAAAVVGRWGQPQRRAPGAAGDEPARALVLWIEEINTHLLADAGVPEPVSRGPALRLDERRRAAGLRRSDLPAGGGPFVLVIHRLHDHDRLVQERVRILAHARLPAPIDLRAASRAGRPGPRLLPGQVSLAAASPEPDGSVLLRVDAEQVRLAPGGAWMQVRVAGEAAPFGPAAPDWQERVRAALETGRPLTVLRVLHRGWWRLEPLEPWGGEG